jgi:hypothetical protein
MFIEVFKTVINALRSSFRSRAALLVENAVLRQQIIVLRRSVPKSRIHARDPVLLALAARVFSSVLDALIIVRPKTVVRYGGPGLQQRRFHSTLRTGVREQSGRLRTAL